jgi:hypothetical protein
MEKIDKKIMREIDDRYKHYKKNKKTNDAVNNDLTQIFDYKKDESIKKFIQINNVDEKDDDYKY